MTGLLFDTHIWFWYLVGSERLPAGLREAIEEGPRHCRLSPISVWEMGMLVEKGRVRIDRDFRSWVDLASELLPLREAPINREVALRSLELELPHQDPADRLLAATALTYDLTLLTVDRRLAEADWLPTRSE